MRAPYARLCGRILSVDLTRRQAAIEPANEAPLAAYLGGEGLATRLLLDRNPAGVDPLSPDNRLLFATGPLCGGATWGASRFGVFTKSSQTGFYAESYSGGRSPQAADATGFDASIEALRRRASAVTDMTRLFNLREGLPAADDRLPARFHREPLPDGRHLPREAMETMLTD